MSLQSVVACRSVKDFSDPALDLIERTYTESFPEVERRDFSLVRNLVRDESRFIVYALSKEDRYVGFITGWLFDGYTYVEHFAIDPAARNGGIGAEAMKQFLVFCGTPVVLEVEMPTDEMSKRAGLAFMNVWALNWTIRFITSLLTGKVENGWRCGL